MSDPRPLVVPADELDEAITRLPLDVVAGLQVAIANVAEVAQASVGADVQVTLAQGQRVTLRELPVSSRGRVRSGRARAVPEHGRDGRRRGSRRWRARCRRVLSTGR